MYAQQEEQACLTAMQLITGTLNSDDVVEYVYNPDTQEFMEVRKNDK